MSESARRQKWEAEFGGIVKLAMLLSFLLLLALPTLLGSFIGPIVHMTEVSLLGSSDCSLHLSYFLTNSGNRAGVAFVTFFVDDAPDANWSYYVPAYTSKPESADLNIPHCLQRQLGVGVESVAAA